MKHKILIFLFSCLATWAFAQPVTRVRLITLQDPPDTTVQYFIQAGGGKDTIKYVPVDTIIISSGAALGTGTANHVAYWSGTNTITGDAGFQYVQSKNRLLLTDSDNNLKIGTSTGDALTTGLQNTFLGYEAGRKVTSGSYNNCYGVTSGYNVTTGNYNNNFGLEAGYGNASGATGSHNNNFGYQSGRSLTTGSNNINIGTSTGRNITSGFNNINLGQDAGRGSTMTGSNNLCAGYQSGYNITSGFANSLIGFRAGYSATSLVGCNFIGYQSGYYNTTGFYNVGIGYQAMQGASGAKLTGVHNTGIGWETGYNLSSGSYNVFVGTRAGRAMATGSYNFAGGAEALMYADNAGSYSVAIGYQAMRSASEIDDNIAIGRGAATSNSYAYIMALGRSATPSAANQIVFGNSTYYTHARFPLTGHVKVPDGTTAQQVTGEDGAFRYNTTENLYSGYGNGAWTFFPYMDNSLAQMTANNFVVNADQSTTNLGGLGLIYNDVNNEWEGAERAHAVLYNGTMDSIITTGSSDYDIITGWNTAGEKSSHWTLTDTSAIYDNCTGACPTIVVKVHMELSVRASSAGNHVFQLGYATTTGVATFTIPQGAAETQYLRASPDVTQVVREIQFEIQDGYEIKSRGGGVNGGIGIPDGGITITQVN